MDSRTLILLVLVACAGPQPTVDAVTIAPGPEGTQRVSLALHNESNGHGEVYVQVILRDAAGHRFPASQLVKIEAHETLQVSLDVRAPAGVYVADVKAVYPD